MRVPGTSLTSTQIPANLAGHLRDTYWIETAEELVAVAAAAGDRAAAWAAAEGIADGGIFGRLAAGMPPTEAARLQARGVGGQLGCMVSTETLAAYRTFGSLRGGTSTGALPPTAQAMPDSARLMNRMPSVKNQGQRGTCVAFGTVGLVEFLNGVPEPGFSEQFLYWACKRMDRIPDESGTYLHTAMAALGTYGICPSDVWPYHPYDIPGNEGQDPPPSGACEEAVKWVLPSCRPVEPGLVEHYKRALSGVDGGGGMPVVIGTLVFASWLYSPETARTGKITMPLPDDQIVGGHAWCVVGYQDDSTVPGGGYFIIRNSWGGDWAAASPEAPGHAMMPYAYVERCAHEAFTGPTGMTGQITEQVADALTGTEICIQTLMQATRGKDGKEWKAGTKVIRDPVDPTRMEEYTERNWQKFLEQDGTWSPATRARKYWPDLGGLEPGLRNALDLAVAKGVEFEKGIRANLDELRGQIIPSIKMPFWVRLIPWLPQVRRVSWKDWTEEAKNEVLLPMMGAPVGVSPPEDWAALLSGANKVVCVTLEGHFEHVTVVIAWLNPVRVSADGQPSLEPIPSTLLKGLEQFLESRIRKQSGGGLLVSVGTAGEYQEGILPTGGDGLRMCCLTNVTDFGWQFRLPPSLDGTRRMERFYHRLSPVTTAGHLAAVKGTVERLLGGYSLTAMRIAEESKVPLPLVNESFFRMQEDEGYDFRLFRKGKELEIRKMRSPARVTVRKEAPWVRRHLAMLLAAVPATGVSLAVSAVGTHGTFGYLVAALIMYLGRLIDTNFDRQGRE